MPFSVITQNPDIVWDHYLHWPEPTPSVLLPGPVLAGMYQYQSLGSRLDLTTQTQPLVTAVATVGAPGGGNTVSAQQAPGVASGWPFVETSAGGAAGTARLIALGGLQTTLALNTNNNNALAAGGDLFSSLRVWWLRAWIKWVAIAAGDPTQNAGIVVMPQDAATVGWPGNGVGVTNRGGVGIVGDGAGQWTHRSYNRTGISLARYTEVLPAHVLTEWNQADFLMLSQRPGVDSSFQFWWNGSLVTTRDWTAADLEAQAGNEWHWIPWSRVDDQGRFQMVCEMRVGRFLVTGQEV